MFLDTILSSGNQTLRGRVTNQRLFRRKGGEKVEGLKTPEELLKEMKVLCLEKESQSKDNKSCLRNHEEGIESPPWPHSL